MNNRFENRPRFGNNDRQRFTPPVKLGEELDVKIEAVGEKGDGVAKKNGFVLFIPNVKEGDYVRVKVTRVLNKVGFAEFVGPASAPLVEEVVEKRPVRESAPVEEEFKPSEDDSEDFGEESADSDEFEADDFDEDKN